MDIIEVSSSPEPSPRKPSNAKVRPKPHKASRPPKLNDSVIEITDSSDEGNDASTLRRNSAKGKVAAGPSRLTPRPVPLHANTPKASSSSSSGPTRYSSHKTKSPSIPLFLPDDGEKKHSQLEGELGPDPTNPPTHNPGSRASDPLVATPEPIPQSKPVSPPPDANPIDKCVAQVLEIVPDVQLDHLVALITKHLPMASENLLEAVLYVLFEDSTYPKVDRKGKRKRVDGEQDEPVPKPTIDYTDNGRNFRGGAQYIDMALEQLFMDFPYIPKPHVRKTFFANNALYVPTYIFLDKEKAGGNLPYSTKTTASRVKGKSKMHGNPDFEAERNWLVLHLQNEAAKADTTDTQHVPEEQENDETGDGIECGCCFATYSFEKMIQCPDAHLFCSSCMTSYASGLLGAHNPNLVCMDQSGCKQAFPLSELRRFLTPKLMELYDRVTQTKAVEAAGLENLEECPFCEYKVVIENEQEKLFRCENMDCAAVTCRGCKKLDHLPKSCKEMEEDKHLDGRHSIEEAMTRALMRNCPKCQKAFIKEMGCNKMTCPNCHTMSCYICRQIIVGYDHFGNTQPGAPVSGKKCPLWDSVEQRHQEEVTAAAKKALADYKRQHPDVDDKQINVDLPRPVPAVPAAGAAQNPMRYALPQIPPQAQALPLNIHLPRIGAHHNPGRNLAGPMAAGVHARKRRRR